MTGTGKKKKESRISGLFRRRRGLEITGYHVGDIRTDQHVLVADSGAVAGNIYAPEVIVAGLLKGLIAAQTTEIKASGQVWGDVYATTLAIEPGGKLHGWFSTIGEEGYQLLNSGSASLKEVTAESQEQIPEFMESVALPAVFAESDLEQTQSGRLGIMRRLQAEAAAAAIARRELELTFEERLAEAAGDEMTTAVALREELLVVRAELMTSRTQLDDANSILEEQEEALAAQAQQLKQQLVDLEARQADVERLEKELSEKTTLLREANQGVSELNLQLAAEMEKSGNMAERTANLETALQGSLQRVSELDEALIRWQELAEESNSQIELLEADHSKLQMELSQYLPTLTETQAQRDQLQAELDTATAGLESAQSELNRLQHAEAELLTLRSVHEQVVDELEQLRLTMRQQPQELVTLRAALSESSAQIKALEAELLEAQDKAQHFHERLLWAEATRQNTSSELEEIQKIVRQREERIAALEAERDKIREAAESWKENVGRSLQRLSVAEAEVQSLREKRTADREIVARQREREEELKLNRSLLEAKEEEISRYAADLAAQGQKLANLHTNLVEREMAYEELRQAHEKVNGELGRVKQSAGERIKQLNAELSKNRQQLKEIAAWMERRRRQE